jgi:hypothetical protein
MMIAQRNSSQPRSEFSSLSVMLFIMAISFAWTACQTHTDTLVRSKSTANETVAIGALRSIASAQSAYSITHEGNYGTFAELVDGGNLDSRFAGESPVMGGYVLKLKTTPKDSGGRAASYSVNADPQEALPAGSTGSRHFYLDASDNAIHVNAKQTASSSDPTL